MKPTTRRPDNQIAEMQAFAATTESDEGRLLAVEMIRQQAKFCAAPPLWNDNPRMPFGQYKGRKIKSIPQDYLRWLADRPGLSDDLRGPVVALLKQYQAMWKKKRGAK